MAFDYSYLLSNEKSLRDTWEDLIDNNLSVPENLLNLLPKFVVLPQDYYDIIAAYLLIPSALAQKVPYLFCCGRSGTGKSTFGKFASYWYGVPINTSSDTYAAIRNGLDSRKYKDIEIPSKDPNFPSVYKRVETNMGMVWDDMDLVIFFARPDLYRLFKVGYDRATSKISISSETKGENLTFDCFGCKIFSSISPLHLDDSFKELRRRLIVILFKKIEDFSDERLDQLGITRSNYLTHLLDIDDYDWKGFSSLFANYWNTELAEVYLITRKVLSKTLSKDFTAEQKAISLDLLTAGVVSGIWPDEYEGIQKLRNYFAWYKRETEQYSGLNKLLRDYVNTEQGQNSQISTLELHSQIRIWLNQGWILEKPKPKQVKALLADLGLVLHQGYWIKR